MRPTHRSLAIFAVVAITIGWAAVPAIAQSPSPAWAPLIRASEDWVDIDTARITRGATPEVSLRWHYGESRGASQFRIERQQVNCVSGQYRIVAAQRVELNDGGPTDYSSVALTPGEAAWIRPSSGSIAAQVLRAVCLRVRS